MFRKKKKKETDEPWVDPTAMEFVLQAEEAETNEKYQQAVYCYNLAIERFQTGLEYDSNSKHKKLVEERIQGYVNRVEEL